MRTCYFVSRSRPGVGLIAGITASLGMFLLSGCCCHFRYHSQHYTPPSVPEALIRDFGKPAASETALQEKITETKARYCVREVQLAPLPNGAVTNRELVLE